MRIAVIGSGAMGGSYGGHMARNGADVTLIDTWDDHVAAINQGGLKIDGALGEHVVAIKAIAAPEAGALYDIAVIFTDTNNTQAAADTAKAVLKPDGFVLTSQNGIGNIEKLQATLGADRVLGGSSMCSAATIGPGHVSLTHMGATSVGESTGGVSPRVDAMVKLLSDAGFVAKTSDDIMAEIWQKFVVNCTTNAIAAVTGLRTGEFPEVEALLEFRVHVIDEVMAVIAAKGIELPDPGLIETIKSGGRRRMNRPSMLQHVTMGRKTEIDALNGALLREAKALNVPVPYNDALVALLKGREHAQIRAVHEPDIDYAAWEARIEVGED